MSAPRPIDGDIALRWSAGLGIHSWIYKHSAPPESACDLVAASAALCNLRNLRMLGMRLANCNLADACTKRRLELLNRCVECEQLDFDRDD